MADRLPRGRVLGLDVGDKRIGCALSDEDAFLATGLPTLWRTTLAEDVAAIGRLVAERGAVMAVLGLPLNMSGTVGPQARKVLKLHERLAESLTIPIYTWDERLTTVEANRILVEYDLSPAKRRKAIDRLSAEIILQAFLDCLRANPEAIHDQQEWTRGDHGHHGGD